MPGAEAKKRKKKSRAVAWKGGGGLNLASQGAWGLGLQVDWQGGAAVDPGHFSVVPLLIQGGIVLLSVLEYSQTRSEAEPRGLGCFSREDSLPPCFRLLSTEQRSEWKPSPNMTSKPLQTMS